MRTAAILPVKSFPRAKQRLGAGVGEDMRVELARAMVGDVLVAVHQCAAIERVIVVTNEPSVRAAAHYKQAIVVEDALEQGQSEAVAQGLERAAAEGFQRALCIPGDCPALDAGEIDALLHYPATPPVLVIPDRHGTGTNGLLLTPPGVIEPSFGADSCERHLALALAAGVASEVARVASLALDIDTSEDLDALRERLRTEHSGAPRTRAVLGSTGSSWQTSAPAA
jgi:2-phospho-L-lactate guanylyltransferase